MIRKEKRREEKKRQEKKEREEKRREEKNSGEKRRGDEIRWEGEREGKGGDMNELCEMGNNCTEAKRVRVK